MAYLGRQRKSHKTIFQIKLGKGRENNKQMKNSPYKRLNNRCWKLMSEIVRRESQGICFTCGTRHDWKTEMDAGHRYHSKLDFDPMNIKAQCKKCNKYLGGNLGEYEYNLIKKYGMNETEKLKARASQFVQYDYLELEEIEKKLKLRMQELINE